MANHYECGIFREAPNPSWVHENPILEIDYTDRSGRGAVALKHLAIKEVCRDQRLLVHSHFKHVPWRIARVLWEYLCYSGKGTMHIWKIFTTRYGSDFRQIAKTFTMKVPQKMAMKNYFGLIQGDIESWGVSMTIDSCYLTIPEIVDISSIRNIVALQISSSHKSEVRVSDRIIRSWSESSGAFQHLQILRLYSIETSFKNIFEYLKVFPRLRALVLHDCRSGTARSDFIELAGQFGWRRVRSSKLALSNELMACVEPEFSASHSILNIQIGEEIALLEDNTMVLSRDPSSSPQGKNRKVEDDQLPPRRVKQKPMMRAQKRLLSSLLEEFG